FYMFRLLFVTFWGDFRGWTVGRPSLLAREEVHGEEHHEDLGQPGYPPHESPWQMTVPLIVLAAAAAAAGIFNAGALGALRVHWTPMAHWLEPVFIGATKGAVKLAEGAEKLEGPLALGGVAAFALGGYIAYVFYVVRKGATAKELAEKFPWLYKALLNKWY